MTCEHPLIIINRSCVPFVQINGAYINGRHFLPRPSFDYEFYSPYRLHICSKDNEGHCVFDKDVVDNCYTYDNHNNIVPIYLVVPCNKCKCCQSAKVSRLSNRLLMESSCYACTPLFVTLTYNDSNLPSNGVNKSDVQKFIKRLRVLVKKTFSKDEVPHISYFLVSEYGSRTHRPHYHMLLFGLPYDFRSPESLFKIRNLISFAWSVDRRQKGIEYKIKYYGTSMSNNSNFIGHVDVRATDRKVGLFSYVSKYITKPGKVPTGKCPNFALRSLGLGQRCIDNEFRSNFIKSIETNTQSFYFNHYTQRLEPIIIDSYILNKMLPSYGRYVPCELRRVFDNLQSSINELASYGYSKLSNIVNTLNSLSSCFHWLYNYREFKIPRFNEDKVLERLSRHAVEIGYPLPGSFVFNDKYERIALTPLHFAICSVNNGIEILKKYQSLLPYSQEVFGLRKKLFNNLNNKSQRSAFVVNKEFTAQMSLFTNNKKHKVYD